MADTTVVEWCQIEPGGGGDVYRSIDMNKTGIEWCDYTWNPVTGCSPSSAGCANCYAARMAKRLAGRCGYPADEPFRVMLHPERLSEPATIKKAGRIFVVSMGDLFHPDVPNSYIYDVLVMMTVTASHHTYYLLTKRPERMAEIARAWLEHPRYPMDNLWWGITCENQEMANERLPILMRMPVAHRFVSVEPMLGPVSVCGMWGEPGGLDWVICGGETGLGARPMEVVWARSLRDQCKVAGVPFFFKQLSGKAPIPVDLQVQQWPAH